MPRSRQPLGRASLSALQASRARYAPALRPSSVVVLLQHERAVGLPRLCMPRGLDFGHIYQDPTNGEAASQS